MGGKRNQAATLLTRSTGWTGSASFINALGVHSDVTLKYTFTVTKNVGTEKNKNDKVLKNTKLLGTLAVETGGFANSALFAAVWDGDKYNIFIRAIGLDVITQTSMNKDSTSLDVIGITSTPLAGVGTVNLS